MDADTMLGSLDVSGYGGIIGVFTMFVKGLLDACGPLHQVHDDVGLHLGVVQKRLLPCLQDLIDHRL
jgi:hypothetical protein